MADAVTALIGAIIMIGYMLVDRGQAGRAAAMDLRR